jgi:hypothetical protein
MGELEVAKHPRQAAPQTSPHNSNPAPTSTSYRQHVHVCSIPTIQNALNTLSKLSRCQSGT